MKNWHKLFLMVNIFIFCFSVSVNAKPTLIYDKDITLDFQSWAWMPPDQDGEYSLNVSNTYHLRVFDQDKNPVKVKNVKSSNPSVIKAYKTDVWGASKETKNLIYIVANNKGSAIVSFDVNGNRYTTKVKCIEYPKKPFTSVYINGKNITSLFRFDKQHPTNDAYIYTPSFVGKNGDSIFDSSLKSIDVKMKLNKGAKITKIYYRYDDESERTSYEAKKQSDDSYCSGFLPNKMWKDAAGKNKTMTLPYNYRFGILEFYIKQGKKNYIYYIRFSTIG